MYFFDRGNYTGLSDNLSSFLPVFEEISMWGNVNLLWKVFKGKLSTFIKFLFDRECLRPSDVVKTMF